MFTDYQYKVYFYYLATQLVLKHNFTINKDFSRKSHWKHLIPKTPVEFFNETGFYNFSHFERMMLNVC